MYRRYLIQYRRESFIKPYFKLSVTYSETETKVSWQYISKKKEEKKKEKEEKKIIKFVKKNS